MDDGDLRYLRSILRSLREVRKVLAPLDSSNAWLETQVLADNIEWLGCFIAEHDDGQENREAA
jgi:hypothetical protein